MLSDPADCAVDYLRSAMLEYFSAVSPEPPMGGGVREVRLFAGSVMPVELWDFHTQDPDCGCASPLVWVRLLRRYRSEAFPAEYTGPSPCPLPRAIALEAGVARCAHLFNPEGCTWEGFTEEFEVSMDDSHRVELALCRAASKIARDAECGGPTAQDSVLPSGPDGGVMAWTGTLYVQL